MTQTLFQVCNRDDYLFVSASEIKAASIKKKELKTLNNSPAPDSFIHKPVMGRGGIFAAQLFPDGYPPQMGFTLGGIGRGIGRGRGGGISAEPANSQPSVTSRGRGGVSVTDPQSSLPSSGPGCGGVSAVSVTDSQSSLPNSGCGFGGVPVSGLLIEQCLAARREQHRKWTNLGATSVSYFRDTSNELDEDQDAVLDHIDLESLTVGDGTELQVEKIPMGVIDKLIEKKQLCFICQGCGKVFWEGSHYSKVQDQFQDILSSS